MELHQSLEINKQE